MMARLAEYRDDNSGSLTTGGILTAYTLTTNEVFDSLAHMDKQKITVVFNVTSGATPTLAVDSLTAKPLRITTGTAPPTGVFIAGTPYTFTYYNSAGEFLQEGAALGTSAVVNANLANMAAWTLKGNNTSGSAAPGDFTIDALTAKASPLAADEVPIWDAAGAAMKKATLTSLASAVAGAAVTVQTFTSGTGATYTAPAGLVRIRGRIMGGGAGGGAATTNSGTSGNSTTFGGWNAAGGTGGTAGAAGGAGGTGGANGTGTLVARIPGGAGSAGYVAAGTAALGGLGGNGVFGGAGKSILNGAGANGSTNTGGGGSGGAANASAAGGGGGSGEYAEFWMTAAQVGASQTYTVAATAAGGTAGGQAGGNGAAGLIIIEEFYS